MARRNLALTPLYPIFDAALDPVDDVARRLTAVAAAGCRLVQLRGKGLADREFLRWIDAAIAASRAADGPMIVVNDRVDLAALTGADGVHLGQQDVSAASAREVLGDEALVGLSTHDASQLRLGHAQPVDYLALGPIFETRSKRDPDPVVGLDNLTRWRCLTDKPVVAIGGVSLDNASRVVAAGADAVAVISALSGLDPVGLQAAAENWMKRLKEAK